jgi:hypothetical protein
MQKLLFDMNDIKVGNPERDLASQVILMAIRDYFSDDIHLKNDAEAFLRSEQDLNFWLAYLDGETWHSKIIALLDSKENTKLRTQKFCYSGRGNKWTKKLKKRI